MDPVARYAGGAAASRGGEGSKDGNWRGPSQSGAARDALNETQNWEATMGLFLLGVLGGAFAMVKWGDQIREAIGRAVTTTGPGRRVQASADEPYTHG